MKIPTSGIIILTSFYLSFGLGTMNIINQIGPKTSCSIVKIAVWPIVLLVAAVKGSF